MQSMPFTTNAGGKMYSKQHLREKVCRWSVVTPVSSTNKTDLHDITEILLKMALNTITPNPIKIYLTNISHFPELLFLEFGLRNVIFYLR